MGRYPSRLSHADVADHPCQPSQRLSKPLALKWRSGLAGPRLGLPCCAHDGLDHDCTGAVIEAGKGVVEADRDPPAMLSASRRTRRSPPLPHDSWPVPIAVIAASQPMPAIAVPSLTLVPVMMNRLVKSLRCSQQPQPIRTPASSGRIPLAQPRGTASRRAQSMAVTRFSRPRPHITDKQNRLICALTHQGHLGCITRALSAF